MLSFFANFFSIGFGLVMIILCLIFLIPNSLLLSLSLSQSISLSLSAHVSTHSCKYYSEDKLASWQSTFASRRLLKLPWLFSFFHESKIAHRHNLTKVCRAYFLPLESNYVLCGVKWKDNKTVVGPNFFLLCSLYDSEFGSANFIQIQISQYP